MKETLSDEEWADRLKELRAKESDGTISKEELTARLKELLDERAEQMQNIAMCYCPAPPHSWHICELCGEECEVDEFSYWERCKDGIFKTVSKIVDLGYDAKVQFCCRECAEKLIKERISADFMEALFPFDAEHQTPSLMIGLIQAIRKLLFPFAAEHQTPRVNEQISAAYAEEARISDANFLFSFRINGDSEYYRRIVNDSKMYERLHGLLAKEDFHIEDYRSYSYTSAEKSALKYMTGLNPDE